MVAFRLALQGWLGEFRVSHPHAVWDPSREPPGLVVSWFGEDEVTGALNLTSYEAACRGIEEDGRSSQDFQALEYVSKAFG